VRRRNLVGEVLQVEGHDRVGASHDCCGENVPVLGIAIHLVNEVLEAVDERLRAEGFPHHADPTVCLLGCHPHLRKVSPHLVQDRFRP